MSFNQRLAEYGANYDVLREAYMVEAKIAYLREDLFGINGSKIAPTLIEEYYKDNYARFKQVFLYTYEYVYETDENGDNIYYKEDGKISYDTSKEPMVKTVGDDEQEVQPSKSITATRRSATVFLSIFITFSAFLNKRDCLCNPVFDLNL